MGGGLVTAAAAVQEQVGLGAQPKLGSACGDRAQDRPVASTESVFEKIKWLLGMCVVVGGWPVLPGRCDG
jgi:hypothetical protein